MDREECIRKKLRPLKPGEVLRVDSSVEIETCEDGTLYVRQKPAKIVIDRNGKKDEAETT